MKKLLISLITAFLCSNAFATSPTLLEVYGQALGSDPIFQQAIAKRFSDQEYFPINLAALLPNAAVTLTPAYNKYNYSGAAVANYPNYSTRGYVMNLTVTQTIFDFSKVAGVCNARAISKEADADLNVATQDLMIRVAKAYFAVLRDEDNLRYNKVSRKSYAKQLDQVNQQYKVGLKTITDYYTASASYNHAVAEEIAAENQLSNDKENLRVLTGVLYPELAKLSEKFPLVSPQPVDIDSWVQTATRQNWGIKAAQYQALAVHEIIKQQYAGHMPTLNLQGSYNVNYSRLASDAAPGTVQNLFIPPGPSRIAQSTGMLNLSIPLSTGGAVIAKTHKAQYDYQIAAQKLEQQMRETVNQTRQSYLGVLSGISMIKADRAAVRSAQSSLDGFRAGYDVGTQTLVDVLNQQQKVLLAQEQYASDRYNYVINLLSLKQAAGTLSQNDLAAINTWLQ